jgi:hypothetical protein
MIVNPRSYAFAFILSLLCLGANNTQALGAEAQDEPHISLEAKNQPLGDVLKKISLDTGFKFRLNDQWRIHPVNATMKNISLHRGLKIILKGLNHAIIYESGKSIKIAIYGKVEPGNTDSSPVQPFSSQFQDNQQQPIPVPESSAEDTEGLERAEDGSEETAPAGTTENESTENEDSPDGEKGEGSEETGEAEGKELNRGSSALSENENEQNEQENASEDASTESPPEQN